MRRYVSLLTVTLAFIFAIVVIRKRLLADPTNFSTVGLGVGTSPYFPVKNQLPIHIEDFDSVHNWMQGFQKYGKDKSLLLWLGNSQLFGINQYKPGQKNSVEYLFDTLQTHNRYVMAYSLPNANLQEQYLLFKYLVTKMPVKELIIPVFFDDLRESGIREELLNKNLAAVANDSDTSALGLALKSSYTFLTDTLDANEDMKALKQTTQEHVEKYLNEKLSDNSQIWASRAQMRSTLIYDYLFKIRNSALNIRPDTKRKKILARYNLNMEAFAAICQLANEHKVKMLVYIPPIRNDVEQPYIKEEYEAFKKDLCNYRDTYGFVLLNEENIVPAKYWGMKDATTMDRTKLEIDFMHFQAEGHRRLADSLAVEIIHEDSL